MISINKFKKYALFSLSILLIIISVIKTYGLYNKYSEDEDNRRYILVVTQKISEDENKVQYLVKLKSDNFILNIYKKSSFGNPEFNINNSDYIYGDELKANGKIVSSDIYGNPRRI